MENYHVSETFKMLAKPEFNVLENLSIEEFRLVRRRMIESILATDMTNHSKHLSLMKQKLDALNIKEGNNLDNLLSNNITKNHENQQAVINLCVHSADISNPGKPMKIYSKWVDLIFEEFFLQGDLESKSNLPISLLCDRSNTNISKAQIGFIKFVVLPTFECLSQIIPAVTNMIDNTTRNLKQYEEILKNEENIVIK